jgi:hypothetical protein
MAAASPIVQVNTTGGAPIANAAVTLYVDTTEQATPLHSRFPYTPFPAEAIRAIGTSNAQGQWVIPAKVLTHSGRYFVVAAAPGYLSQFSTSVTCGSFTKTPVSTLSLESISNYAAQPSTPDINFYPVRIDTFHYSFFEREDRMIVFPYVPGVRSSLCPTLETVDVTMHIVGAPMPDFFPQGIPPDSIDLDYHQTVTATSVALFKMNAFRFQLPVGVYYFYFELILHHSDKTTQHMMYYPQRAGYSTYPAMVPGPTSTNSIFHTFNSEIIVYPVNALAQFSETQAPQLVAVSAPAADVKKRISIVLLNSGFDPAEFLALATQMVKGNPLALDTVSPFADNMDRFSIVASTANFSTAEAEWPLSNNWGVLSGTIPLTKSQKIYLNGTLGPKPLLFLLVKDPTFSSGTKAGSGFCSFENGTSISIASADYTSCMKSNGNNAAACATALDLSRVFLHELGHELGMLGEEYYEQQQFFDVNDYETSHAHFFTPYYKPNTAFPSGLDIRPHCYQTLFSYSSLPSKAVMCTEATATDACTHVPWHDLVGKNGVGCYMGGGPDTGRSRPNLMKPQHHSIMDFAGDFNSVPIADYAGHVYGLANERSLCQAIQAYTQSVSPSCQKLCLQGCASGKVCNLNGQCVAP